MANGVTIIPNGQTLIVTGLSTNPFYTEAALSTAVTLPAVITSNTIWYCSAANAGREISFTITQPDGTKLWDTQAIFVGETWSSFIRPAPSNLQLAADVEQRNFQQTYTTGSYYGTPYTYPSTNAAGTGVLTCVPFWVRQPFTADRIGCSVTTGAGSAVARLGIYANSSSDQPSTLLLDAGTVDASATANVEATISFTFGRGLYWLAAVSQVASATMRCNLTSQPPVAHTTLASAVGNVAPNCYTKSGVTGALADLSSVSMGGGGYLVVVRAA